MLQVRNLSVRFGQHRRIAVNDVSFDIAEGQRLGLIGESGSGKSVTALAIMGLLPENAHVEGSIRFRGQELLGAGDRELRRIRGSQLSMVFQEPMTALDPTMQVGRQVAEAYLLHHRRARGASEVAIRALDRVGLGQIEGIHHSYPHELSGGQRQRVLLAMALVNDPALVICDEPTTALDVVVQAEILTLLRTELEACLFITHDIAVMASVCPEVAVMLDGTIVESGPTSRVLSKPEHPYTRGLIATSRMEPLPGTKRLPVVDDYFVRSRP